MSMLFYPPAPNAFVFDLENAFPKSKQAQKPPTPFLIPTPPHPSPILSPPSHTPF